MRFHKFDHRGSSTLWVNLDAITIVEKDGWATKIGTPSGWWIVNMKLDEVLALIQQPAPAAAPPIETAADRHKAAHAKLFDEAPKSDEAWAKMTPGEIEYVARRDELDKLMQMFRDPFGFSPVTRYVEERRGELAAQQQAAESDDADAELRRAVEAIRRTEQPQPADHAPEAMSRSDRKARVDELNRLEQWWRNTERIENLTAYIDRRLSEM